MAQEINLLDPFGVVKMVRGQVNSMCVAAKLPQIPEVPTIKMSMAGLPLLNKWTPIADRPGMSRGERAG